MAMALRNTEQSLEELHDEMYNIYLLDMATYFKETGGVVVEHVSYTTWLERELDNAYGRM